MRTATIYNEDREKQALNEKLARWAGLVNMSDEFGIIYEYGESTHSGIPRLHKEPPSFTSSLDACFKWLASKLKDRCLYNYEISIRGWSDFKGKSQGYKCQISIDDVAINKTWDEEIHKLIVEETPALALCRAIEKLI